MVKHGFPIEEARISDVTGDIEGKISKPMGGKISGKGVTIRNGKSEQWYKLETKYLKTIFHIDNKERIVERLNRLIDNERCPRIPVPTLEDELRSAGLLNDDKRNVNKLSKGTYKISGQLESEPDATTSYSKTRRLVTTSLMNATNDKGDRLFTEIKGFQLKKDSSEFSVIAKIDKKSFNTAGEGMSKEESLLKLAEEIEKATIGIKTVDGAVRVELILDLELQD